MKDNLRNMTNGNNTKSNSWPRRRLHTDRLKTYACIIINSIII
jgi:hypothetical protein